MLTIVPGDYVVGVWVVLAPDSSFLITVKQREGEDWELYMGVRTYVDDKVEDSRDTRRAYRWKIPKDVSEETVTKRAQEVASTAAALFAGELHFAPVRSADSRDFAKALETLPGMHSRTESVH